MKKMLALLLAAVMVLSLVACGGQEGSKETTAKTPNTDPAATTVAETEPPRPAGTIELVWWTNYGEKNVALLQTTIDKFNESQSDYHLTIEYQGNANELMAKLNATNKDGLPDLFNHAAQRIGTIIDVNYLAKLQDYIDKDPDGAAWTKGTYQALIDAYSYEGKLVGYPNGYSYGVVYYNKDMFAKAGINPADIHNMNDLYEAGKKLVDGGFCKKAIGFHPSGYYANCMLAYDPVDTFDAKNGMDGRVTKCLYMDGGDAQKAVTAILDYYKKLYAGGYGVPYGANWNSEVVPLIASGDCAMGMGVISQANNLIKNIDGKFKLGVLQVPAATNGTETAGKGAAIGGTGIFMANTGDYWKMKGAYEFIKFMAQGEYTSNFSTGTGYLACSDAVYQSDAYQTYIKDTFPGIQDIYDHLKVADGSAVMPFNGVVTEIENQFKSAIEKIAADPSLDVMSVQKTLYEEVQDAIDLYNASNPVK